MFIHAKTLLVYSALQLNGIQISSRGKASQALRKAINYNYAVPLRCGS
jgi:hypothetical protein